MRIYLTGILLAALMLSRPVSGDTWGRYSIVGFDGNAPLLDPPSRDTQVSYLGEQ